MSWIMGGGGASAGIKGQEDKLREGGTSAGDFHDLLESLRHDFERHLQGLQWQLEHNKIAIDSKVESLSERVSEVAGKTKNSVEKLQSQLSEVKNRPTHPTHPTHPTLTLAGGSGVSGEEVVLRSEVAEAISFCRDEVSEKLEKSLSSLRTQEQRSKAFFETVVLLQKDMQIIDQRLILQSVSSSVFCLDTMNLSEKERESCLSILQKKERHLKRQTDCQPSLSFKTNPASLDVNQSFLGTVPGEQLSLFACPQPESSVWAEGETLISPSPAGEVGGGVQGEAGRLLSQHLSDLQEEHFMTSI